MIARQPYAVAGVESAAAVAQDHEKAVSRQSFEESADPPRGAPESSEFLHCTLRAKCKNSKTRRKINVGGILVEEKQNDAK